MGARRRASTMGRWIHATTSTCTMAVRIQTPATSKVPTSRPSGAIASSAFVRAGARAVQRTFTDSFVPADGFTATEQICFNRGHGQGEYVILVTDAMYYQNVHWMLEGYIVDGKAHDLRYLDFTTIESKDGCETPGVCFERYRF